MANSSTKSNQNGSKNQTPPPFFPPNYNPVSYLKGEKSERFWFATAMIPLRMFLGISFIAAGLDKLTDPQFFNSSAPGYIGQQLTGFAQSSPIGSFLTNVAVPNATIFGWMVLLGELAIGLGTLVGLFSRTAAFFGAVLSLTLWISSSFSVVPFFLGPDLPYAIGWITLMLAGAHPVYSLDSYIKAPAATPAKPTAASAKAGKQAQPVAAAVTPDPAANAQMARRRFVLIAGATLVTGMATGVAWAKTWKEESTKANTFNQLQAGSAGVSSSSSDTTTTAAPAATAGTDQSATTTAVAATSSASTTQAAQTNTTQAAASGASTTQSAAASTTTQAAPTATPKPTAAPAVNGTKLVALASLPVGAGFKFTTPDTKQPAMVFHEQDGSVKAFSLICTHEGCTVEYYQQYKALACPCHGAVYDITNGQPTQGPARRALTAYKVQVDGSGNVIYVQQ